ncbi:ABC transporter ATP-binding protein [Aphanothece hegewaldii CCALA 016]|uniref:ABC transporter ATP-binding protein n=1 Tax=Aphanothece hegewaldii CCALA 016 TaxID=2107694 RepID=A0A2T1M1X0_9CHRO|nr:ABC transporter ATP-binding protein/permease [Aphanothece hegewaldii]PSF38703.1 ABC transporter ATP-binding protein [Aphanothece hegewaldii CCALA 016]
MEKLKQLLSWFGRVAKPYWTSSEKWKAIGLLAIVISFIIAVNFASVTLNEVQGKFVTSLSEKKIEEFQKNLLTFMGIILALFTVSVIQSIVQQKLSLYWREWLTKNFLARYFNNKAFYKVNNYNAIDNPDQRISDDLESFVGQTLNYTLDFGSNLLSGFLFIGVLWSLNHSLVWIALATASIQTLLSFLIGRILTPLNFKDLQYQADFRYGLVHVRNNSESIAFYQGEKQESKMLQERFSRLLAVLHQAIYPRSGLNAFNVGIVYLIFLLAYWILAPQYFSGQIPFGDISRSTHAFTRVLFVFGWFANSFEGLTLYAAVIKRLGTFAEFLDKVNLPSQKDHTINTIIEPRFALSHVTLKTPDQEKILVENLVLEVPTSEGILLMGPSGVGKSSILRAVAGLWDSGKGYIYRPSHEEMLFIPQRPYMTLGSLRNQIIYPHIDLDVSNEQLQAILEKVNLSDLASRVGGFDVELNWADVLSLGEQQRLAFARLFLLNPKYAVLDESTSALDVKNERHLYQMLKDSHTTYISVGHRPTIVPFHEIIVEFLGLGKWRSFPRSHYSIDDTPVDGNGANLL